MSHSNSLPTSQEELSIWIQRYIDKTHRHNNPRITKKFLKIYNNHMRSENIPEYVYKSILKLLSKSYSQKTHDEFILGLLDDPFLLNHSLSEKYRFSCEITTIIDESNINQMNRSDLFLLSLVLYKAYHDFRKNNFK